MTESEYRGFYCRWLSAGRQFPDVNQGDCPRLNSGETVTERYHEMLLRMEIERDFYRPVENQT